MSGYSVYVGNLDYDAKGLPALLMPAASYLPSQTNMFFSFRGRLTTCIFSLWRDKTHLDGTQASWLRLCRIPLQRKHGKGPGDKQQVDNSEQGSIAAYCRNRQT